MHQAWLSRLPVRAGALAGLLVAGAATAQVPAATVSPPAVPAPRPDCSPVVSVGSRITWNVPYVVGAGAPSPQQILDVYAPAAAAKAPVVLFVHGGEWAKGDKSEVSFKPKFLNENGIILVSVDYRLSDVAPHPAQVDDVAAAVRWTRDHIADHGGDPGKIVLLGHSAGTHLVALLALDPRPLARVGMTPGDLRGVVSWSGSAFDLVEKLREGGENAPYITRAFGDTEAGLRDASPMTHVATGSVPVPFLFASAGQATRPAARAASEAMAAKIRAAGGRAAAVVLPGKTHFAANHELGMPNGGEEIGAMLLAFVREATR